MTPNLIGFWVYGEHTICFLLVSLQAFLLKAEFLCVFLLSAASASGRDADSGWAGKTDNTLQAPAARSCVGLTLDAKSFPGLFSC